MKKILLIIIVLFGLNQTQAQVSYCDSLDISITNQTMNDITLSSGLSVNAIPGIVNLDWILYLSNGTVFAQDTTTNPTFSINQWNMDSLPICLTTLIDINGNVWTCYVCDTIVWNGTSWMLMSMAQPQTSYCDSLSYTTVPGTQTLMATGNSSLSLNMIDSITWLWTACNSSTCYTAYGDTAMFTSILTTDTVKLCYDAYVYFMGQPYVCTECDSLVYDGFSYSWVLLNMGNPTGVNELVLESINNNKMYDLLGRELTEVKVGQMYIRNNKKYIRVK